MARISTCGRCARTTAIIEIDPFFLLRLIQLHFRMSSLGLPRRMANQDVVAVEATFDWRTLERLREMRGNRRRVLAEFFERPAQLQAA
jgi:acyl-homoserine lactone synthase